MDQDNDDFSYRHLSDAEEQSGHQHPHLQDGAMVTVVTHDVVVGLPQDDQTLITTATLSPDDTRDGLLLPEQVSPHGLATATAGGSVEPSDWASEEGSRQNLTRGPSRRASLEPTAVRRESVLTRHRLELPQLLAGTTNAPSASPRGSPFVTPRGISVPPAIHTPQPKLETKATLHGKDLRQFVSIGSIDQIARHSNSVDWSEAMANHEEEPDHLSLMDPYYDLTKAKLTKLFSLFHPDANGMVGYDGFRRGLEAMGIVCADDEEFRTFIEKVDEDGSGGISYDEFQHAIQEIKLAQLFKDDFIREMATDILYNKHAPATLGSIEYSPDRIRSVYPIGNVEKFIYSKKPSWAAVRWISVEGHDPLMLRRLSVRYRLHPLAVEDALDIDRERPKYEKYDEHSSLILQTVRPVDTNKLRNYQRMYRNSLYTRDEGPSIFEQMEKKELEDRLEELRIGKIMTNPEQLSVYLLQDILISVQEHSSSLWGVIKSRLDTSYSKIRQHGTPFLAYSIVDACVDDLTPIVHTLGAKLAMLERLITIDPSHFDVTRLHHCAKQLKGLKRLCKPLNEVVEQMTESKDFTGEIERYFRDVQDHIAIIEEDCDKHLDSCKSLVDQFHNIRAAQQGDVSFLLTLVAAIFLPAQFATGLYGMNFEVMPELKYANGYYIWWVVVLAISAITIFYFHYVRRWF